MRVEIQREPKYSRIDHLFVVLAEGDDARGANVTPELRKRIAAAIASSGFTGKAEAGISSVDAAAPKKLTLIGLGKKPELSVRAARTALRNVAKAAGRHNDRSIAVVFPYTLPGRDAASTTQFLADVLAHSDYKYDRYLTTGDAARKTKIEAVYVAPESLDNRAVKEIGRRAEAITAAVRTVRDLGNGPGNLVTPEFLADRAVEVCKEAGVKCTVFDKKAIQRMKMGGLLAVNQGSALEPRFVVMEYSPRKARKTVCVVGKGITFDSGGISIKPAEKMEEMKFDMCGAANTIGIVQAAAALELPVRVIGIFASTENLPGGRAYKPGDIITTMSGKTVEIVNTDAEGRMILADALHYASTLKPDHLIDFATLTGACVVALGNEAAGLFTPDTELAQKLIESGDKVGERVWRMPEWDEYKELIRSEWADVKNSGGRWGGAITAAVFLKEFVSCPSWAHVDIAGTASMDNETPREARGATGAGVRMIVDFLESLG